MQDVILYSPVAGFGKWDWSSPDTTGVGGSETSHIMVSTLLTRRGYNVMNYSPLPDSCEPAPNWRDCSEADFTQPGVWLIYRSPESVDKLTGDDQTIWIVCQDVDYPGQWTPERVVKIDKVFALCEEHAKYLAACHKELKGKIYVWSNGFRMQLARLVDEEQIERNPKRLMYASSPDRGLVPLVSIFQRARERVPDLELHVYYGLQGFKVSAEAGNKKSIKEIADIEELVKQPGITYHDRTPQVDLYREWAKAGIWCHPTNFSETSCITCMDAQAMGAIPITNPYWALKDNVKHGVFIPGDAKTDKLVQARYVEAVVRLAESSGFQDSMRDEMMQWARMQFNWERVVDVIESHIVALDGIVSTGYCQSPFQHRWADGRVLNIGCGTFDTGWDCRGAVSIDSCEIEQETGRQSFASIFADARRLPEDMYGKFDSVILGDI